MYCVTYIINIFNCWQFNYQMKLLPIIVNKNLYINYFKSLLLFIYNYLEINYKQKLKLEKHDFSYIAVLSDLILYKALLGISISTNIYSHRLPLTIWLKMLTVWEIWIIIIQIRTNVKYLFVWCKTVDKGSHYFAYSWYYSQNRVVPL